MSDNKKIIKTLMTYNENYLTDHYIDVDEYMINQEFLLSKIAYGVMLNDSQIKLLKIDMASCNINLFRKCILIIQFYSN